jgi:hypothetical protein
MKDILLSGLMFLLCFPPSVAQTSEYDTSNISKEVRRNASLVVRSENIEFEVFDIGHAKLNVHRIITILNESGKDALFFNQVTDKFISLEDFEIKVYDAAGKSVHKYKKKDLSTVAPGQEFMDDYKVYYLDIPVAPYPLTVEFSYELRFKGTLSFPPYNILSPGEGVVNSSYSAKIHKGLDLRYKEKNIHLDPSVTDEGKFKQYTWTVKDLTPVSYEEGAVSYESRYPSILLAPNHFKLDEYEGDMSTWQSFGKWYADLKKGLDVLPESRKQFYQDLVKNAGTDREKIRIVYSYLQKNFRYVSIQLGIGGFKPFSADYTDSRKYGDCKALSNYLQSVLSVLGIKSYQALINASYNKEPVDPQFPCELFNHVILCVPNQNDSIWLECTSRTNDFGSLGSFTENRNALLITEDGGVLVSTPKSKYRDNILNATTTVDLQKDGSGKTRTIFRTTGEYKQILFQLRDEKSEEQKSYTISHWGFKDPGGMVFGEDNPGGNFQLSIEQDLEAIPEFKAGRKMFLTPRIYKLWTANLPKTESRRQDYYFNFPFEKIDTTVFNMPSGYKMEALPEARTNECRYASYSTRYWYNEKSNAIYSVVRMVLKEYKIPSSDYKMITKFFDDVLLDNQQRIVIMGE